jgi:ADP-dependent NAD(P)H-hydrate dehydratase / NAD(P)H-hydrate epimerase
VKARDESGRVLLATVNEAQTMDRLAIERFGLPGQLLMELAGAGTAQTITHLLGGGVGRVTVLCGGGNNAGDGYVVARHLLNAGWDVVALSAVPLDSLLGDAKLNCDRFRMLAGDVRDLSRKMTARAKNRISHADIIVDALFGLGLNRSVEGVASDLIKVANRATHGIKVAVDVPSGVDADRGCLHGSAFRADHTVTYGLGKPGLHIGLGRQYAGSIHRCELGIPQVLLNETNPQTGLCDEATAARLLPLRDPAGHKGSYGHVGVVGGFEGKEGAAVLACLGALYGAAGLVTWIGKQGFGAVERPAEIMTHAWNTDGLDNRSTVLVVGPGLGQRADGREALEQALKSGKKCVLDADALNLLAERKVVPFECETVLTPHPAEAARLLHSSTETVTSDPLAAARQLATKYQATVLLKGAESVVANVEGGATVVHEGDATLSVGGTGDVLAGLVAAFTAQGMELEQAAILGAFVHGRAGKECGRNKAQRGVTARLVAEAIPDAVSQLSLVWTA